MLEMRSFLTITAKRSGTAAIALRYFFCGFFFFFSRFHLSQNHNLWLTFRRVFGFLNSTSLIISGPNQQAYSIFISPLPHHSVHLWRQYKIPGCINISKEKKIQKHQKKAVIFFQIPTPFFSCSFQSTHLFSEDLVATL